MQHDKVVRAIAFRPDGKAVLTGSNDKTARLWDAATGQPIAEPLRAQAPVWAVAFSPDGKVVLTGSADADGIARLWDAATGQPIGTPMRHQGGLISLAFSPDGKAVLTGSFDQSARIWDAATGQPIGIPMEHQLMVTSVAFSPDGKSVLTGSTDGTARFWDAVTGQPMGLPAAPKLDQCRRIQPRPPVRPDRQLLMAPPGSGGCRIWKVPSIGSSSRSTSSQTRCWSPAEFIHGIEPETWPPPAPPARGTRRPAGCDAFACGKDAPDHRSDSLTNSLRVDRKAR